MTPTLIWEICGYIALVLNLWGNLKLTTMSRQGWIVRLVANLFWAIYSIHTAAWVLLLNHCAFTCINIRGWMLWRKENQQPRARLA